MDEGDAIKTGQTLGMLDKAPHENALLQAKAGVSVARAQYDLMLAGYRDEEIAQPPPPLSRRKPPMTTRRISTPSAGLWKSRTISANDLEMRVRPATKAQATLEIRAG